ncbi:hypothetical protein PN419_03045 [Halorubrum ezzemoulense]|uniref:DUF8134 domain-containing protein n=1 Tax=Halorubrum ezzemoulense TaxID=337243 RepID=A0A238UWC6_HALEZ|nr:MULTISPECIES: hypothetical protein [Halorubrum]MDB2260736.1 hypothetical protein [Halorubrum ezzemoulense]MDB2263055.1 hypothetical protein [Halorubrum ezzemoulense]MDB2267992.1 hypothetical protein [Halorubrum ezzemoulense]MDB2282833.1 hypothetical protein [Halorubrum ezzemoulense]MDB9247990.1 hypothetical protein [Halorubrum ezzemoulense]
MTTRLRVLDDGAWISVNDSREVRVSELWRLDAPDLCECALADLAVENFQSVGVDGSTVDAKVYGQCVACGATEITAWVPIGRVHGDEFAEFDRSAVRRARRRE